MPLKAFSISDLMILHFPHDDAYKSLIIFTGVVLDLFQKSSNFNSFSTPLDYNIDRRLGYTNPT